MSAKNFEMCLKSRHTKYRDYANYLHLSCCTFACDESRGEGGGLKLNISVANTTLLAHP